jgi:hypothetical protein
MRRENHRPWRARGAGKENVSCLENRVDNNVVPVLYGV